MCCLFFFQCLWFWYADIVNCAITNCKLCIQLWIVQIQCSKDAPTAVFLVHFLKLIMCVCTYIYTCIYVLTILLLELFTIECVYVCVCGRCMVV